MVEKEEPVIVVAMADADGDGVADDMDACPATPAGTMVDATGCPKDSDKDGVLDVLDKCPETPAGTLVDADGCPVEKVSVALDIKFAVGKADLSPDFDSQLAKVSDFMKRFPDTTVVIEGHTDNAGSAVLNKKLSQARADAVRKALVDRFGVAEGRVNALGFGAEKPLSDNASAEGRAANRRVVATISAVNK